MRQPQLTKFLTAGRNETLGQSNNSGEKAHILKRREVLVIELRFDLIRDGNGDQICAGSALSDDTNDN